MNVFMFIFFIFLLCGHSRAEFSCITHATMLRQLEREGFHVDIQSLIELLVEVEDATKWSNCTLVLREQITDSFYVNPDQLSELSRLGLLEGCTFDKVDIEAPQYLAIRHTLYVYSPVKKSQNLLYTNLRFPLHLRYQKPKPGGGYSVAEFKSPTLLIRCEDMDECQHLMKSKAPCSCFSSDLCNWMRISYKTNAANFTLLVPIGNLDHLNFVKSMTYMLTFGGCIYVTLSLFIHKNRRIRKNEIFDN